MKYPKNKTSLEDLLIQITKWKIEASSPYNDGWTQQHYQKILDRVQNSLGQVSQEIEDEELLDNYDSDGTKPEHHAPASTDQADNENPYD
jgi:hypothetical protein